MLASYAKNDMNGACDLRLHASVDVVWQKYNLPNGSVYFDPGHPKALETLMQAASESTVSLGEQFPELGFGTRGVVFNIAGLAIKRCTTDIWDGRTGIGAVAANLLLAKALDERDFTIGNYRLLACTPRGLFQPTSLTGEPTWAMDLIEGLTAEDTDKPPQEATQLYQKARDKLCAQALRELGVNPDIIFLDSQSDSNLIINEREKTLTIIDAMAADKLSPAL